MPGAPGQPSGHTPVGHTPSGHGPSSGARTYDTWGGSWGTSWGNSWGPTTALVAPSPTGGWIFLSMFDAFRQRKVEEEEERKKKLKAIEKIDSSVDKEIADLLQQDSQKETREKQLQSLEQLVAQTFRNEDLPLARAYSERVAKAFVRVAVQGNFSAIEALEREMERTREEEEILLLALAILE